jgi:ureidoacrylate peracid hydrolase
MPDSEGLLIDLSQKVDPARCAVVVIDVQNDFAANGGFFAQIGADVGAIQQQAVPALQRLIAEARKRGVTVIFVQAIYDPHDLSEPMRERNLRLGMNIPRCLTGSWGADFYEVRPAANETTIIKHRYSAMMNTGLDAVLKARGIRSLLLTGIATDTCVESTGRDAYFVDYYVTMVSDCCGAFSAQDHAGALRRFARDYGAVVTSEEVIAAWAGGSVKPGVSSRVAAHDGMARS